MSCFYIYVPSIWYPARGNFTLIDGKCTVKKSTFLGSPLRQASNSQMLAILKNILKIPTQKLNLFLKFIIFLKLRIFKNEGT